jgi:alpha-beta hydrolase superfamily lysophospholipase
MIAVVREGVSCTHTYADWVDLALALVEAESARDGRPVVLFGASIGGMLAYDVAARSERIEGIIATCLIEPAHPQVRRAAKMAQAMQAFLRDLGDRTSRLRPRLRQDRRSRLERHRRGTRATGSAGPADKSL